MKYYDEDEIRTFLQLYKVNRLREEIVNRTKRLMREEMAAASLSLTWQGGWLLVLLSTSLIMSMCIFYMLTVGTILNFTLPSYMLEFLHHSIIAFTAAGACFLSGFFMVFIFKHFEISGVFERWIWTLKFIGVVQY